MGLLTTSMGTLRSGADSYRRVRRPSGAGAPVVEADAWGLVRPRTLRSASVAWVETPRSPRSEPRTQAATARGSIRTRRTPTSVRNTATPSSRKSMASGRRATGMVSPSRDHSAACAGSSSSMRPPLIAAT